MTRHRPALLCFCALILALSTLSGCNQGGGKVLATVNKAKITVSDFEQQVTALQSMRNDVPLDDGAKRQLLEQMVKQELLVQTAGDLGLDKKPEVQEKIVASRKAFHEQLEAKIESAKAQLKHMDKDIRSNIMIEELLKLKSSESAVNESEAKGFYDNLKKVSKELPPYAKVADRIKQQLLLEKLVAQAKEKAVVTMHPERVAPAAPSGALGLGESEPPPMPPSKP